MMKIKLKSRNVEKLQRFSALFLSQKLRKSEQILVKAEKIMTKFENTCKLFLQLWRWKRENNWQHFVEIYLGLSGAKACSIVNLGDLVKSFLTNIYLQKSASIQPRTILLQFFIFTEPPRPSRPFGSARSVRGREFNFVKFAKIDKKMKFINFEFW